MITPFKDKLFSYLDSNGIEYKDITTDRKKKNGNTSFAIFLPDVVDLIDSLTPEKKESIRRPLSKRNSNAFDFIMNAHEYLKNNEHLLKDINGDRVVNLWSAVNGAYNKTSNYSIYEKRKAVREDIKQRDAAQWSGTDPHSIETAINKLLFDIVGPLYTAYNNILGSSINAADESDYKNIIEFTKGVYPKELPERIVGSILGNPLTPEEYIKDFVFNYDWIIRDHTISYGNYDIFLDPILKGGNLTSEMAWHIIKLELKVARDITDYVPHLQLTSYITSWLRYNLEHDRGNGMKLDPIFKVTNPYMEDDEFINFSKFFNFLKSDSDKVEFIKKHIGLDFMDLLLNTK